MNKKVKLKKVMGLLEFQRISVDFMAFSAFGHLYVMADIFI